MGAYKLETFDANEKPAGGLNGLRTDILERERNEAYGRGFKDGVNVTNDAIENERNRLLASISEMIGDRNFTHEEAAQKIMRSLSPLIDVVIRRVAPALAGTSFHATLDDLVTTACKRATNGGVILQVPAGQGSVFEAHFADRDLDLSVTENHDFGPREARVDWDGGTDSIDLDKIVSEIDHKLNEFLQTMNEGNDERARDAG